MDSVARPTNLAAVPCLLSYAQSLKLERHLVRWKRGVPTLALAVVWLVLAWRGTGRSHRLGLLEEPLLAAAFRAAHVDGLATLALDGPTILLARPRPDPAATDPLLGTGRTVRLVA